MKLSIIMMAYNQGKFIDDAITSILNQELPEKWELLIGDDHSTDQTKDVVKPWLEKYPNNIFYFYRENNIGLHANYVDLMKKAKGEFIALLEADDYWIDPQKTKLQLELLDKNPEIAWVTTDGCLVDEKGQITKIVTKNLPEQFDFEFYLKHFFNPLNNATIFRKSADPEIYPDYFFNVKQWDTVLYYLRSLKGKIGYIPIQGLAWRRHENATSFSTSFSGEARYKDWIIINNELKKLVPKSWGKTYFSNKSAFTQLSVVNLKQKNIFYGLYYFFLMIFTAPTSLKQLRDYFWRIRN